MLVNLLDGQGEASVSEVKVVVNGVLPVSCGRFVHDLVETRVDDVDLAGALQVLHVGRALRNLISHLFEHLEVLLLGVLLGHATGCDVVQVLEPLEVGAGDTTTVDQKIGGADDASLDEDLFSSVGGGTVGTLEDSLDFDITSVSCVE